MRRIQSLSALGAVLFLLMVLFLNGCSSQKGPTAPDKGEMVVTVSVTGWEGEPLLEPQEVGVFQGNTAFEATAYILKEHRIAFAYDPASKYVRSIGEVAEFDHGSGSGWLYRVNGDFSDANRSSGEYLLQDGDRVEWLYTADMGRDLGLDTAGG